MEVFSFSILHFSLNISLCLKKASYRSIQATAKEKQPPRSASLSAPSIAPSTGGSCGPRTSVVARRDVVSEGEQRRAGPARGQVGEVVARPYEQRLGDMAQDLVAAYP